MNNGSVKLIGRQIEKLLKQINIKKPKKGKAAVFFDIDGTISRNDNLELFITEITNRNLLPASKEEVVEQARKLWKSRDLDFDQYIKIVIDLLPNLKNFSFDILDKVADDVISGPGSHFYLFPWLLLMRLKNLGFKLIAVSGAPSFMAEKYLDRIGLFPWKIHSSEWIFKDQIFTGKIDISILKNKGKFIYEKYHNEFDLSECIAIGDTVSDISMLKKVGKAIVINPTYELAQKSIKNKWTILLERKDLVITFPDGKLNI